MRDLIIITITTLTIAGIWIGFDAHEIVEDKINTNNLLEIATPFNGRIDAEYLNDLEEPAYAN